MGRLTKGTGWRTPGTHPPEKEGEGGRRPRSAEGGGCAGAWGGGWESEAGSLLPSR